MARIKKCALPEGSLLAKYARSGAYTDCYTTVVRGTVTHAEFVTSFYITWLFRIERLLLKLAVSRPSSDVQATLLAEGTLDNFAAWYVEARATDQLLMCDFRDRTRSWLMVSTDKDRDGAMTRLYFGSAVVPVEFRESGKPSFGLLFNALIGFHKLYSVALLRAARSALLARRTHIS